MPARSVAVTVTVAVWPCVLVWLTGLICRVDGTWERLMIVNDFSAPPSRPALRSSSHSTPTPLSMFAGSTVLLNAFVAWTDVRRMFHIPASVAAAPEHRPGFSLAALFQHPSWK